MIDRNDKRLRIISEIGVNHDGDFRYIEELIRQSALGCADWVKFQLYDSLRVFGDESRKHNEFTFAQVKAIFEMCSVYGITFLASAFDEEKVDWCERLGVEAYKIASRTVVREPKLCEAIIALGKPTFVSLAFWREQGLPFADRANVQHFNCISKYPTTCFDYEDPRPYQGSVVGVSDHSYGLGYCLYSIALGAGYVEKHFTLNKTMRGNDHIGSMDREELRALRYAGDQIFSVRRALAR